MHIALLIRISRLSVFLHFFSIFRSRYFKVKLEASVSCASLNKKI